MYPVEKKRKLTQTPQVNKDKEEQEVNKDKEEQEVNKQKKEQKNRTITIFLTDLLELINSFINNFDDLNNFSMINKHMRNALVNKNSWILKSFTKLCYLK
ncbi:hypothetical protein ABK040_014906 [Willaertia magna]